MPSKDYKYKAFISYSHQDKKWGDWLHKALETYRVPKELVGKETRYGVTPKRLFPIFRDREELPTSAELGEVINKALDDSSHLIVICSPRSAKSQWVDEEIKEFKRLGKSDQVLCLIVDGEPNATDKSDLGQEECFPEAAKYKVRKDGKLSTRRTEPIAADAREGKDGKRNALLKLVAGLLAVGFDDLKQREAARRQKRMAIVSTFSMALVAVMAGLTFWALGQQQEAERQQTEAERQRTEAVTAREEEAEQRQIAETQRGAAIKAQEAAEQAQKAESEQRQIAETQREAAVKAQKAAEQAQKAESEQRQIAESQREAAVKAQKAAEQAQKAESEQRQIAETQRGVAVKAQEEEAKQRQVAETALKKAKAVRKYIVGIFTAVEPSDLKGVDDKDKDLMKLWLRKATEEIDKIKGQPEIEADVRYDLGRTLRTFGFRKEALVQLEKSLASRRKGIDPEQLKYLEEEGPPNPRFFGYTEDGRNMRYLGYAYGNIAGECLTNGEHDKAIEYYDEALKIGLKVFGPKGSEVAALYSGLSEAYRRKGEHDKASEYMSKTLAVLLALGAEHPEAKRIQTMQARLGAILTETRTGLKIIDLLKDSAAEKAGLQVGDVIVKLNGKPMLTLQELMLPLLSHKPGQSVQLDFRHRDKEMTVNVKLGGDKGGKPAPKAAKKPKD